MEKKLLFLALKEQEIVFLLSLVLLKLESGRFYYNLCYQFEILENWQVENQLVGKIYG